eukprot:CAMPEP_0113595748 /NCGR_PEP_ID=MMETSP0015_2-20120614/39918_1 /TAXON_ID=2838 /ORGANISM="Odontella" /LENGTH=735 /DNA_ID=CAMNT_0000503117 /DNA_START=33 /DNA_END=2240 /DNA_ORIENTATION=- /assembly_acc=CAM_ASM_000160
MDTLAGSCGEVPQQPALRTGTSNGQVPAKNVQIASSGVRLHALPPGGRAVPIPAAPPGAIPIPGRPIPGRPIPITSFNVGASDGNASPRLSSSAPSIVGRAGSWDHLPSPSPANLNQRRQKRLERNRESARLSRRRRKQYLEVLEERVTNLSQEMDRGRREHVVAGVKTVREKRRDKLMEVERNLNVSFSGLSVSLSPSVAPASIPALEQNARLLDTSLSRTSDELRIAATFQKEQLKSFSNDATKKFVLWLTLQNDTYFRGGRAAKRTAAATFQKEQLKSFSNDATKKFVLWLTLQNDTYFRGGRAPSERLSAARIGERMLHSGNDRVTPANGMWPLFCNEVGLSYDQEEKVRSFQRSLLSNEQTWLHRHTGNALNCSLESAHTSVLTINDVVRQRERSVLDVLTLEQRVKFQAWAAARAERIGRVANKTLSQIKESDNEDSKVPQTSPNLHDAANLFQNVCERFPAPQQSVPPNYLKKLSRRPSFESLGITSSSSLSKAGEGGDAKLSRDLSHSSTGSLKRAASELSMSNTDSVDGDDSAASPASLTAEAAQAAAANFVSLALNPVRDIIPPPRAQAEYIVSAPAAQHVQIQHLQQLPVHRPQPIQQLQAIQQPQPVHQPQYSQKTHYVQVQQAPKQAAYVPEAVPSAVYQPSPVPLHTFSVATPAPQAPVQSQQAQSGDTNPTDSNAVPSVMNIVPEEGYLNTVSGQGTDEFLFDLTEEDWAIGGGFDMDTI